MGENNVCSYVCMDGCIYIYLVPSSQRFARLIQAHVEVYMYILPKSTEYFHPRPPNIPHITWPSSLLCSHPISIPVPNASSLKGKPPTVSGHLSRQHTYPYLATCLPRTCTRCTRAQRRLLQACEMYPRVYARTHTSPLRRYQLTLLHAADATQPSGDGCISRHVRHASEHQQGWQRCTAPGIGSNI